MPEFQIRQSIFNCRRGQRELAGAPAVFLVLVSFVCVVAVHRIVGVIVVCFREARLEFVVVVVVRFAKEERYSKRINYAGAERRVRRRMRCRQIWGRWRRRRLRWLRCAGGHRWRWRRRRGRRRKRRRKKWRGVRWHRGRWWRCRWRSIVALWVAAHVPHSNRNWHGQKRQKYAAANGREAREQLPARRTLFCHRWRQFDLLNLQLLKKFSRCRSRGWPVGPKGIKSQPLHCVYKAQHHTHGPSLYTHQQHSNANAP